MKYKIKISWIVFTLYFILLLYLFHWLSSDDTYYKLMAQGFSLPWIGILQALSVAVLAVLFRFSHIKQLWKSRKEISIHMVYLIIAILLWVGILGYYITFLLPGQWSAWTVPIDRVTSFARSAGGLEHFIPFFSTLLLISSFQIQKGTSN